MDANEHPYKVAVVKDDTFYANEHPYKVKIVEGGGLSAKVVDELPEEGETGYIYLVLKEETEEGDIYDEWIWAEKDGEYVWEHLGATNEVTIMLYDSTGQNTDGAMTQKAVTDELGGKQNTLTAGSNIQINNDTISATDTTYSDFTGTDGTAVGTAGLVPAPATTDAGKYLKADGTWDEVQAGPTVVQSTGTSTTDVMSQKATTNMIYPAGSETSGQHIRIGKSSSAQGSQGQSIAIGQYAQSGSTYGSNVAIGYYAQASGQDSIAIGSRTSGDPYNHVSASAGFGIAIGAKSTSVTAQAGIAIGAEAQSTHTSSIAMGRGSRSGRNYELSLGSGTAGSEDSSQMRYIAHVNDPQYATDAANKRYTDNLVISYSAIEGSSAPTTATEGKYVGQLYFDTTNDKKYYLKAVDTTTDPDEYEWEEFGRGGIPADATFWGASYDSTNNRVDGNIYGQVTSGSMFVVRGSSISDGTAYLSLASNSVGLYYNGSNSSGFYINSSGMNISNIPGINLSSGSSNPAYYKKIFNMADPTNPQDAATKNYVDTHGAVAFPTETFNSILEEA